MAYYNQLSHAIGSDIQVNRGNSDAVQGTLISIQSGHLVLKTKDSLVYVNTSHIKNITEIAKQKSSHLSKRTPHFIKASSFHDVMHQLRLHVVQIHRAGSRNLEGVLAEVTNDHVLLVVKKEIVRIPLSNIKSVSVSHKSTGQSNRIDHQRSSNKSGNKSSMSGNRSEHKSGGNSSPLSKQQHASPMKSGMHSGSMTSHDIRNTSSKEGTKRIKRFISPRYDTRRKKRR